VLAKASAANQAVYQNIFGLRDALKTLGASDAVVATQLKNAGFGDEAIGEIMKGQSKAPALPRPKEVLDAAKADDTILAVANQAVQRADTKAKVDSIAKAMLAAPNPAQQGVIFRQAIANGDLPKPGTPEFQAAARAVVEQVIKPQKDETEKMLGELNTTNGNRAAQMFKMIRTLPDDQKVQQIQEWQKAGLLPKPVQQQLGQLLVLQRKG